MNSLQKEFESTGGTSWVNSDLYPDGKTPTKEYVKWLEQRVSESDSKTISLNQALEYEVRGTWWATFITWEWMLRLVAKHLSNKTRKKHGRYAYYRAF